MSLEQAVALLAERESRAPGRRKAPSSRKAVRHKAQGGRQAEDRQERQRQPRPTSRRNRRWCGSRSRSSAAELPSREAILAFIAEQPGKAGKREIARAFGITGAQRIGLKRLLKDMAEEGVIDGRRKHIHPPGDLPSVTVLAVEGIDDQGEAIGVPVEWDEEWGTAPRIVIAPEAKLRSGKSRAAGQLATECSRA